MSPEDMSAVVGEIRERVRRRYEKTVPDDPEFRLPSLDPLGEARDTAEGKAAAIGSVNPRPPGLANHLIQSVKRFTARLLNWLVREQVDFNRAAISYMDRNLEAQIEQNYAVLAVARRQSVLERRLDGVQSETGDMARHWKQWRPAMEDKLTQSEINLLHKIRDMEEGARGREAVLRSSAEQMHRDYEKALAMSGENIQQRVWKGLADTRTEFEQLIHTELRLIRRRASAPAEAAAAAAPVPASSGNGSAVVAGAAPAFIDYSRFEERFRGGESYVAEAQQFYLPYFRDCESVADLGCGRGEFLGLLKKNGIKAAGVDFAADAVAACREKGLDARQGDLFEFLAEQPADHFDGIFCAHVVEHLSAEKLPQLITLAAEKLKPGGVFAAETPNPSCLAIFAADFYLDPTHVRPVPANQMHFYMEESGFGQLEVHELHSAAERFPEIEALEKLDELRGFRRKFFGGLDYAIVGRKLGK